MPIVVDFALAATSTAGCYVAAVTPGVLTSPTWTAINTGLSGANLQVERLNCDLVHGNRAYICTAQRGVVGGNAYVNSGLAWGGPWSQVVIPAPTGYDWSDVRLYVADCVPDPTDLLRLYALVNYNAGISYANSFWLYRSLDGGGTWTSYLLQSGGYRGRNISICPTANNQAYVAGDYISRAREWRVTNIQGVPAQTVVYSTAGIGKGLVAATPVDEAQWWGYGNIQANRYLTRNGVMIFNLTEQVQDTKAAAVFETDIKARLVTGNTSGWFRGVDDGATQSLVYATPVRCKSIDGRAGWYLIGTSANNDPQVYMTVTDGAAFSAAGSGIPTTAGGVIGLGIYELAIGASGSTGASRRLEDMSFTPAKKAFSRVFLIEGGARPDHAPEYMSCVVAGAVSRNFGDTEDIECQSADEYGAFEKIGEIQGQVERAGMPLTGRYAADLASRLLEIARKRCSVDVQVHFGACTDPSEFNKFTKSVMLEDARLGNYETEELGAMSSDENAAVNETSETSSRELYETVGLGWQEKAKSIIANEVLDGVFCSSPSCGDCDEEDGGCDTAYFITKTAAGGSPTTPADVVYTLDGGLTWNTSSIDSLPTGSDPSGIACVGAYVVVISQADNSLHYVLKSDLDAVGDETWTRVATGFVAGGGPNAIWSVGSVAFIVGQGGYIYKCIDPTAGVTVLSAADVTTDNLLDVHAISSNFAVASGNNGAFMYTANGGDTWTGIPVFVLVGTHFNCCWAKDEKTWLVGTNGGRVYYTVTEGTTWTEKTFTGSGAGVVYDISFSTKSVGYMAHATATPRGRILRTYDGGYSWNVMPETTGSLPLNDRVNVVATCKYDPNIVIGGGLADNGTDGFLVVGVD